MCIVVNADNLIDIDDVQGVSKLQEYRFISRIQIKTNAGQVWAAGNSDPWNRIYQPVSQWIGFYRDADPRHQVGSGFIAGVQGGEISLQDKDNKNYVFLNNLNFLFMREIVSAKIVNIEFLTTSNSGGAGTMDSKSVQFSCTKGEKLCIAFKLMI